MMYMFNYSNQQLLFGKFGTLTSYPHTPKPATEILYDLLLNSMADIK